MRNRFNYTGLGSLTRPPWAGRELNPEDLMPGGAKLAAANFTAYADDVTVTMDGPAAIGDASITVDALSGGIPAGTMLNFGGVGKIAYTTEAAVATDTTIAVAPLTAALADDDAAVFNGNKAGAKEVPSGTLVSRTYAQRDAGGAFHPAVITSPAVPAGEYTVKVNDAAAHVGDTSFGVDALPVAIPSGTDLDFGGVVVHTTAPAAAGAVSLAVTALDEELADNTEALYPVAEIPAADEDEYYLTAFDIRDLNVSDDVVLVAPGDFPVRENFLPGWADLSPELQAIVRSRYNTTIGAD